MKKIIASLSLIMFCPIFARADLVVRGPGYAASYYYADGEKILVKNCGQIVGAIKGKADCKTEKISETFLASEMASRVHEIALSLSEDKLAPYINATDFGLWQRFQSERSQDLRTKKNKLSAEILKIKTAIKDIGGVDFAVKKDLAEREAELSKIEKELEAYPDGSFVEKRLLSLAEDLAEEIKEKDLETISAVKESDQAAFQMLKTIANGKRSLECGLGAGLSLEARIKNCDLQPQSSKRVKRKDSPSAKGEQVLWSLVMRWKNPQTSRYHELWKDSFSGLIWGDILPGEFSFFPSEPSAFHRSIGLQVDPYLFAGSQSTGLGKELACGAAEWNFAVEKIKEKKFSLPTWKEVQAAERNGLSEVVPNLRRGQFWAIGQDKFLGIRYSYDPAGKLVENANTFYQKDRAYARCVIR